MLLPRSRAERLLSVLAPWHVVVLPLPRLVALLDQLMREITVIATTPAGQAPYLTMITGPSRTTDIERVITIGAHGPRRLQVNLCEAGTVPEPFTERYRDAVANPQLAANLLTFQRGWRTARERVSMRWPLRQRRIR